MSDPLRVLVVEDAEDDLLLLLRALRRGDFDVTCRRVVTAEEMRDELASATWDAVVADHRLPRFSSGEALAVLQESGLDLPFIIVSGTIGEEAAVAAMKAGAHDYLTKSSLARLAPAMRRELRDAAERAARRHGVLIAERERREKVALLESTAEGIYGLDRDGRCTFVNRAAATILGYLPEELLGTDFHALVRHSRANGSLYSRDESPIQDVIRTGKLAQRADDVLWSRQGTAIPVEFAANPVVEGDQINGVVVTFRDISERLRLEAQLRQAQKMEAVGKLAGGIAHDFNNLLTVITGFSELLLDRMEPTDKSRDFVEHIRRAGESAASLTRQLLAFSRQQVVAPQPLDLNTLIVQTSTMLRRLIGEDLRLVTHLAGHLDLIFADPGQIEQVLMNLSANARDAMGDGGTLTIETANAELDQAYVQRHPYARIGPYVRLTISDTGSGMDLETQTRIFEPFFTTKEVGKGTGLGLSAVYGIVKQSDGYIDVDSAPGQGTAFHIYLPRLRDEASRAALRDAPTSLPVGSETILLVEDEEKVLALACLILESCGYHVLPANSSFGAMEIATRYEGAIHLLLTDVVMPGTGGRKLAEQLSLGRPEMLTLYMSGYTDDVVVRHGVVNSRVAFLQKPFTSMSLARRVRDVLDSTRSVEK